MSPAQIEQKLWNYCNVLRDDGMSYGDYVEQLTYLLFLKMSDERSKPPYDIPSLDIFWLKDDSLEASENLPEPDIIAREIVTDLQDALAQFQLIAEDLGEED